MIVLDASVLIEVLLKTDHAERAIVPRIRREELCAPHLIDIEAAHALRRFALAGEFDSLRGEQILRDLADFPIERYPHAELLERIWEIRDNLTAYDAAYVALAEALQATLVTCDGRLHQNRERFRADITLL